MAMVKLSKAPIKHDSGFVLRGEVLHFTAISLQYLSVFGKGGSSR